MQIIIVSGPEVGLTSQVADDQVVLLGRQGTLNLADCQVSKRHARLRREGSGWYIEDLGSTNGTYVNGERVSRPNRLNDGDTIQVGSTAMVITRLNGSHRKQANVPISAPRAAAISLGENRRTEAPTMLSARYTPDDRSRPPARPPLVLSTISSPAPQPIAVPNAARRWRSHIALAAILVLLFSNLLLIIVLHRRTRQDLQDLRTGLERNVQGTAELLIQEVRGDLRSTSQQNRRAAQELNDRLAARQEAFADRWRADLSRHGELQTQQLARWQDQLQGSEDEAQATHVLRELTEIKAAIAELRVPPDLPDREPATPARVAAATPTPPTMLEPAPATPNLPPVKLLVVIDASGGLQHALPQAMAELHRVIAVIPQRNAIGVLLLHRNRLIQLDPADVDVDVDDILRGDAGIDRGPADLRVALKLAADRRPPMLHLFIHGLDDGETSRRILSEADVAGTTVHVTQFFSREGGETLKALAREHQGYYTFIPSRH